MIARIQGFLEQHRPEESLEPSIAIFMFQAWVCAVICAIPSAAEDVR
ncbi:MAG: hypothetical protein ACERNK_11445 [Deltaproteobacteria bacterium]